MLEEDQEWIGILDFRFWIEGRVQESRVGDQESISCVRWKVVES